MRLLLPILLTATALPAAVVRIEKTAAGYQFLRDGKPFLIKGAVARDKFDQLAAAGANAARTSPQNLDELQRHGLCALVGLPLGNPRKGFNYEDPAAIEKQRDRIRETVNRYKRHPAVLLWAIGNEPEIHTTAEQRRSLWREVNEIAKLVKSMDPDHPVITVIGDAYRRILHEVRDQVPAIDAIGLNAYVDMLTMPEDVKAQGWDRPWLVSEFGPRGHWQVPKTPWRVPIEDTSSEKAAFYERAYRHAVLEQPACLGSFVFLWYAKQEKTHTWYGMFLDDGSRTESVDVMTRLWSGRDPANRSPRIGRILATPGGEAPAIHKPSAQLDAEVQVSDPDGDPLKVTWDLRPDVADNPNVGGDFEESVPPIPGSILSSEGSKARVQVPAKPGNYRLFVYAHDGKGNAATANLALRVE
jgi:hypothetical protein